MKQVFNWTQLVAEMGGNEEWALGYLQQAEAPAEFQDANGDWCIEKVKAAKDLTFTSEPY